MAPGIMAWYEDGLCETRELRVTGIDAHPRQYVVHQR